LFFLFFGGYFFDVAQLFGAFSSRFLVGKPLFLRKTFLSCHLSDIAPSF